METEQLAKTNGSPSKLNSQVNCGLNGGVQRAGGYIRSGSLGQFVLWLAVNSPLFCLVDDVTDLHV